MSQDAPALLLGTAQNYAWGKPQDESLVFKLSNLNTPLLYQSQDDIPLNKQKRYAELWLGTHPSGPARIIPIDDEVSTNKQFPMKLIPTDDKSTETIIKSLLPLKTYLNNNDLPFLFKTLSIHEALSIQSHPDKKLAERLHQQYPDIYKDPNHKPELVLAVTPMRALCGFRPLQQILTFLLQFPLLTNILYPNNIITQYIKQIEEEEKSTTTTTANDDSNNTTLKQTILRELWRTFHTFNTTEQEQVKTIIQQFQLQYQQLKGQYHTSLLTNNITTVNEFDNGILSLCYELSTLYPNDIAIFSPLFLHYFSLQPGQSIFLGPNIPHAYLYGDCIEVMACSDNVIRAGLTPKFRDVDNLLTSLTYQMTTAPLISTGYIFSNDNDEIINTIHQPPVGEFDEFLLLETKMTCKKDTTIATTLPIIPNRSILLMLEGSADVTVYYENEKESKQFQLSAGNTLYLPSNAVVSVGTSTNCLFYECTQNISMDTLHQVNK